MQINFHAMKPYQMTALAACFLLVATMVISTATTAEAATASGKKYNIIFFLVDDERFDSVKYTDQIKLRFQDRGITFVNAFATTPYCCPARGSYFAGGIPPNETGVLSIVLPNGGATQFNDTKTLATYLQQHGYTTALMGKYLNDVEKLGKCVPAGWNNYTAVYAPGYWNFTVVKGSSTWDHRSCAKDGAPVTSTKVINWYGTNYLTTQALDFINQQTDPAINPTGKPIYLEVAYHTPHDPATPLASDVAKFANFTYSSPGTNETDVSDKPLFTQQHFPQNLTSYKQARIDFARNQLSSLQAVDRSVQSIMDTISKKGLTNKTVFIFASDNGVQWGEHGWSDKALPYEESIRVPMMIRVPGITGPKVINQMVSWNLDLPATIYDIAGVTEAATRGTSLLPLIEAANPDSMPWRDSMMFQEWGVDSNQPAKTWFAIRTAQWKYVEYTTGEKELYDLVNDPYELQSQHANPAYQSIMAGLKAAMDASGARGLTITTQPSSIPSGTVGQPYQFQMQSWGGKQPLLWQVTSGALPEGLQLCNATGTIMGTPTTAYPAGKDVQITVYDSSISIQNGKPQRYALNLKIVVN